MTELLDSYVKNKQPATIQIPFHGRILLKLYWWYYRAFVFRGKKSYEETIKALDTPWKVQSWFWNNIKYTSDKLPQDSWQPAERTFERRRADCEDYAVFANECLKSKYDCYFLCMYNRETGHATYLISDGKTKDKRDKWISVGTYGYMQHVGRFDEIVPDWSGFEDWIRLTVFDENMKLKHKQSR